MPPPHEQPPEPFFEPLPPPELHTEPERVYFQAPWQPPQNVMPVPVPISVELARTGDTVVALTGMEVYPAGRLLHGAGVAATGHRAAGREGPLRAVGG